MFIYVVRPTGLEPAQISPPAPQAGAATNYATDAYDGIFVYQTDLCMLAVDTAAMVAVLWNRTTLFPGL